MTPKTRKTIALTLLVGLLAMLFIEVTFYCINAPIQRDIDRLEERIGARAEEMRGLYEYEC